MSSGDKTPTPSSQKADTLPAPQPKIPGATTAVTSVERINPPLPPMSPTSPAAASMAEPTASALLPPPPPPTPVNAKRWNEMITRLDQMQSEIHALQRRNFEKDRGKEFESSYTRVIFLMTVTYFTLLTYMALVIESNNPYLDAIVPTVGFNISTWSLPYVKEWWIQARHYYLHGESERATSLRRLMVCNEGEEEEQDVDDDNNFNHEEKEEIQQEQRVVADVESGHYGGVEVVTTASSPQAP